MKQETLTPDDIETKKVLDQAVEEMKRPFKNIADAWVATFFGEEVRDYNSILSNIALARDRRSTTVEKRRFFHWELVFPEVWFEAFGRATQEPGFSAIIGNPPYLLLQPRNIDPHSLNYYRSYEVSQYKIDIFHLFIQQSIDILARMGCLGMITPSSFLLNNYTVGLRSFIWNKTHIIMMHIFHDGVFEDANVDNVVFVLRKISAFEKRPQTLFLEQKATETIDTAQSRLSDLPDFGPPYYHFQFRISHPILPNSGLCLGEIATVNFGMQLRDRKKFPKDVIDSSDLKEILKPYMPTLGGNDIIPFYRWYSRRAAFFDESARCGGCWDYRVQTAKEKVLVRQIGDVPYVGYTNQGETCLNALFIVIPNDSKFSPKMILGYPSSHYVKDIWMEKYFDYKSTFPKIKGSYLKNLPIPNLSMANWEEIENLVDRVIMSQIESVFLIERIYESINSNINDRNTKPIWSRRDSLSLFGYKPQEVTTKLSKYYQIAENHLNYLKSIISEACSVYTESRDIISKSVTQIDSILKR
jgi:hypothetical protein